MVRGVSAASVCGRAGTSAGAGAGAGAGALGVAVFGGASECAQARTEDRTRSGAKRRRADLQGLGGRF